MNKRAVVYARQSIEVPEGIAQQVARCRALAAHRGWSVLQVYEDDATSASKRRGPSTGWGRMLAAAQAGDVDVVVAVDVDRLVRGLPDLIALSQTGAAVATVDGEIDLGSADGEFRATMLTALARFEVRRKAERRARMDAARRANGLPAAGKVAFGYRWLRAHERGADGVPWAINEKQAAEVRRAYGLLLGGYSLGAICADLNASGSRTTSGKAWRTTSMRRTLLSPFYCGRLPASVPGAGHYRVEAVDPQSCTQGAWPPLVDVDTWLGARAVLLMPSRRTQRGTARRHLLGGLALCGTCGQPVRSCVTRERHRGYRCASQKHFQRRADLIDQVVETAVVRRLASADLRRRLAAAESPDASPLRVERAALAARLDGLSVLYADGTLNVEQVRRAKVDIQSRLRDVDLRLAGVARHDTLTDLIRVSDVRAAWAALTLHGKRAAIDALCTIRVQSSGLGVRASVERPFVVIEWRDDPTPIENMTDVLRSKDGALPLGVRSSVVSAVLFAPTEALEAAGTAVASLRPEGALWGPGRVDLDAVAAIHSEVGRRWDALSDDEQRSASTALLDLSAAPGGVHRVALSLNDGPD